MRLQPPNDAHNLPPSPQQTTEILHLQNTLADHVQDQDRITLAMELILGVSDPSLSHRIAAVSDVIGQHGHKLAFDGLLQNTQQAPVAHGALAQAIKELETENNQS